MSARAAVPVPRQACRIARVDRVQHAAQPRRIQFGRIARLGFAGRIGGGVGLGVVLASVLGHRPPLRLWCFGGRSLRWLLSANGCAIKPLCCPSTEELPMPDLLIGQTLSFAADPQIAGPAARHETRGGVLLDGGRIARLARPRICARPSAGACPRLRASADLGGLRRCACPLPADRDHRLLGQAADRLAEHLHLPRGDAARDPAFARATAETCLDLMLAHGTTTMCSYATIHPESVDAFFAAAQARGMRALAGKTCMDRNAPEGLRDTARSAHDDSAALIARWHGVDRLSYVITPRFAPTSSPEQLEALGALWAAHPDCLMQTHLSEQTDEIAWVRACSPRRATIWTSTSASACWGGARSSAIASIWSRASGRACARPARR
jgi:hypothetical protein